MMISVFIALGFVALAFCLLASIFGLFFFGMIQESKEKLAELERIKDMAVDKGDIGQSINMSG